jgi:hypothetical protein
MIGRKLLKRGPTPGCRLEKPALRLHAADASHVPGLAGLPDPLGPGNITLEQLATGESRIEAIEPVCRTAIKARAR